MGKNVIVVGGGIVGLCSAYYLLKEGHQVTVIDKSDITAGASFVNAGYITPSHIIPLAAPGMIVKGMKWMFSPTSPFYMKPRWDVDFFKWAWYFHKSSTPAKVAKAIPVIKDINLMSHRLYTDILQSGDLGDFQWERKGLLMLYQTDAEEQHEMPVAEKAKALALEVDFLDQDQLRTIEPDVAIKAKAAIHYKCDGHTTPTEVMPRLKQYLTDAGVDLRTNEAVLDFSLNQGTIKEVITSKGTYACDAVIIATGSWSEGLAKKLNIKLPIQAGKGYRIDVARPTGISMPAILMEAKVAVTPMNGFTRFAGTMEFSGINDTIRAARVTAIAKAVAEFYPDIKITAREMAAAKSGLRPVSPDGLPYIGKSKKYTNLTFATGHAMMGWSLGPATGKLVAQLISDKIPELDLTPFSPDRKF